MNTSAKDVVVVSLSNVFPRWYSRAKSAGYPQFKHYIPAGSFSRLCFSPCVFPGRSSNQQGFSWFTSSREPLHFWVCSPLTSYGWVRVCTGMEGAASSKFGRANVNDRLKIIFSLDQNGVQNYSGHHSDLAVCSWLRSWPCIPCIALHHAHVMHHLQFLLRGPCVFHVCTSILAYNITRNGSQNCCNQIQTGDLTAFWQRAARDRIMTIHEFHYNTMNTIKMAEYSYMHTKAWIWL